jgi:hypothetical protein
MGSSWKGLRLAFRIEHTGEGVEQVLHQCRIVTLRQLKEHGHQIAVGSWSGVSPGFVDEQVTDVGLQVGEFRRGMDDGSEIGCGPPGVTAVVEHDGNDGRQTQFFATWHGFGLDQALVEQADVFQEAKWLLTDPSCLILDEPSRGVDVGAKVEMYRLIADCAAAAVIGGTSLMGGEGSIFGAIIGALIMASLDNGMSLMNLDSTWQYIVKGLILLLAVWVDMAYRRRGARG